MDFLSPYAPPSILLGESSTQHRAWHTAGVKHLPEQKNEDKSKSASSGHINHHWLTNSHRGRKVRGSGKIILFSNGDTEVPRQGCASQGCRAQWGSQSRGSQLHHPGGPGETISSFRRLPHHEWLEAITPVNCPWAWGGQRVGAQEAGVSAGPGPALSPGLCD